MTFFSNGLFSGKKTIVRKAPLEALVAPKLNSSSLSTKTLLRTVKLSALFIFLACLQVSAKTEAQRVSISLTNSPLERLFKEIEQHTNYVFFYDVAILKDTRVSVQAKDETVEEILAQALRGMALSYAIHDRTIFIKNEVVRPLVPTPSVSLAASPASISGIVRDQDGKPLAGATVTIHKLKKSGLTNAQGQFLLKDVPNGEYQVEVSFVGYEPFVTTINVVDHEASITADLKRVESSLDAPVVIPYGVTTKRLATSDITTVTAKEIGEQPVSNPLAALEGRVPGLVITQNTGAPGGGFTVQLRGLNSLFNSNQPFFVIDGVPYNSQLPKISINYSSALVNNTLQGGSPLSYINPSDIESIEVLKDADATAIYGSRAANGAILITTKKGKAGKTQIDVNVSSGFQQPARTIPFLNTPQYLSIRHEAFKNDNTVPNSYNAPDLAFWDTTRYTNWQKTLVNKLVPYNNAQVNFSGGNATTQYLVGGTYATQQTPFPTIQSGDGMDKKTAIHFNLNTQTNDRRLKLSFTGNYIADKNTVQSTDFASSMFYLPPDAPPIYNPDGSLNMMPLTPGGSTTWTNPYLQLNSRYKQNSTNLVTNSTISYSILSNWDIRSSFGYSQTNTDEIQAFPTTISDPAAHVTSGNSNFNNLKNNSWIIEPQTSYKLSFSKAVVNILLGSTFQAAYTSLQRITASKFVSDAVIENPQAASSIVLNTLSTGYKYSAAFSRINFNWADKYLLNITGRRDGSSRFGTGRQFGNFGAIGGAWVFSRESFLQNVHFLSFGKLRASYGSTGNDGIADYQYFKLYTIAGTSYDNIQGLLPSNVSNPDLAWEVNKKLEGGIELGLFRDRIIMQASYYRNRSGNQLTSMPISLVTGFSSIASNLPALVENSGQEFVLNSTIVQKKNFTWSSSFNLTISRNKLLDFPNLANSSYKNNYRIGQPINNLYLFHLIGVNDTTGVYQFATVKGTPTYDPNFSTDRLATINTSPKFYGGWGNSLRFKSISLDFLFQFVKQTGVNIYGSYVSLTGSLGNLPVAFLDRWQKPGDKAKYERYTQDYSSAAANAFNYAPSSDFAYGDASFIRLKNVAISWQIPNYFCQKLHLGNGRLYLQGQNLLTITKYDGIDPESQGLALPPMRTFTAGIQITF